MLVILEIIISVITMKSQFVRKIMNGKSAVIIKNGVIDQHMMRQVRMTVLDLVELLRGQEVFDISTVAFAVLEVNGNLSVLLKSAEQPVTAGDIDIKKENATLPLPVISDGRIIKESLDALETDEEEIKNTVQANGTEVEKVFLMTMDRFKNINLVKMRSEQ